MSYFILDTKGEIFSLRKGERQFHAMHEHGGAADWWFKQLDEETFVEEGETLKKSS